MSVRKLLPLLPALLLGLLVLGGLASCSPTSGSIQEHIQKRSRCTLSDFQIKGSETKISEGYKRGEFTANIKCGSSSFLNRKFPEPASVEGFYELAPLYFGLYYEVSRYDMEEVGGGDKSSKKEDKEDKEEEKKSDE
jgi:hypothetical protein